MLRYALLLSSFLLLTAAAQARTAATPVSPEAFVGENVEYDVSFLWFDRLAEGSLTFSEAERPGTYRAVLEARTRGVASWLTGDRVQRYISLMEKAEDGRLRPLLHESEVIRGRGKDRMPRVKRYLFDHEQSRVLHQSVREGKVTADQGYPIETKNPPADILTAFFNFRAGVYGPVREGKPVFIPTFSHRGLSDIVIEKVPAKERRNFPFFPGEGLLCRVSVDKEIFGTGDGDIYVWFNEAGQPARGIVENVLGMGNVRGEMR